MDELLDLAFEQARDRDPRPRADDRGDVVLVDLLLDHRRLGSLLALGQLLLELGKDPVPDLGDPGEVALALLALGLHAELVDLTLDVRHPLQSLLLARPARHKLVPHRLRIGELALDGLAHALFLVRHGGELDLELPHAAFGLVELDGRRVDLHAEPRSRLVDEVDRLVREEAVGDVAIGEHGCGDEGGVADLDAVVGLVALLQPTKDRDRVRDGRLADEDGLEAPLERGVLLDVLPVLVERRRTDRAELAAREHRLEQVRSVDRTLRSPRAHDRVQLVDEEDDVAGGVLDFRENGLEPLLELTAVLRTREESAHVERPYALALQPLGHVARDDSLREPLDDRGLPHPWLADEHRVVLRPPREHLDHSPDLLVAPDHRVELPRLGERGEVAAVLLERLVRALGVLRRDPLAAANVLEHRKQRVARENVECEQEVLDGDEVVAERPHLLERPVQHAPERGRRRAGRSRPRSSAASAASPRPPRAERSRPYRRAPRASAAAPGRGARSRGGRRRAPGCPRGARCPVLPRPPRPT